MLPLFSERFHLGPAAYWSLTHEEFGAYMTYLEEAATDGAI